MFSLANISQQLFSYWPTLLTLFIFFIAVQINRKIRSIIFNPFIISSTLLILILYISKLKFTTYMDGNRPITILLAPSVVALAVPLYQQIHIIKEQWQQILLVTLVGTIVGMLSSIICTIIFGADLSIIASLLPKSVTTPIALAISEQLNGIGAVTVISVILAGIFGVIFGYLVLNKLGVKAPIAIGLGMGCASHALGTAKCHENDVTTGNYSSLALVLCGVMSSISAPIMYKLLLLVYPIIS